MKVIFRGENLEYENGAVVPVQYEDLRMACLESGYPTLSIAKIIKMAVTQVIGEQCKMSQTNYRDSELFLKLEADIRKDSVYQEKQKASQERNQNIKKEKEIENIFYLPNMTLDKKSRSSFFSQKRRFQIFE